MEKHESGQAEWRAVIIALVILCVVLGVEQLLPIADTPRSQIGVLTVLLWLGIWPKMGGLAKPGKDR